MTAHEKPKRYARCPWCGTSEGLVVTEIHEEIGTTNPGRHEVRDGLIFPASNFYFSPGRPIAVEMQCAEGCGHEWRSRRLVGAR